MSALAPHWGALLGLALFLAIGLGVLDDRGFYQDESANQWNAIASIRHLLGDVDALPGALPNEHNKFYGMAFEAPLLLAQRAFDVGDVSLNYSRATYVFRHLITHLVFLAGGLAAYLLALRLLRNRFLALAAMALFLLHPRLHAHSYHGSIDIPFLVMFVAALFLARRAFRRDTLSSFALLGAGVGILVNLRIMGVVLIAVVLAMRALDAGTSAGWAERKRALLTTGAFALAAALTVYALMPYLWPDPIARSVEWWTTLSDHPTKSTELFRGTGYRSDDLPPEYLPVWFSVTSPPFALLLGLIGAGCAAAAGAAAGRRALRNTRLRFALMLLGSFLAPFVAVVLLDLTTYDAWRQMYFLWAPFSLLAAFGAQRLAGALRGARRRGAVYGALGLGLGATVVSMALIHPNQQDYFNFFVDRATSEHLRTQYRMNLWQNATRQELEWILQSHAGDVRISGPPQLRESLVILPDGARDRLSWSPTLDALVIKGRSDPHRAPLHRVEVYGNTLSVVERKEDFRAVYEATRGREPIVASAYDVYRLGEVWAIVKEPCAPSFIARAYLSMRIAPVDRNDLRYWLRDDGFEVKRWYLPGFSAYFDGKCVGSIPMPNYPVAGIEIISLEPEPLIEEEGRELARRAQEEGQLLARSAYDLYLSGGELIYIRQACDPLETESRFYLDVVPAGGSPHEQEPPITTAFDFHRQGAFVDGACLARAALPERPIAWIRTGQRGEGGAELWSAAFSLSPERYRAVYESALLIEPVARGAFDVHAADGALLYVRERCEPADTESRFFLHVVPERAEDLPEERREVGFGNLDFDFFTRGALFDGKCAARVPLPGYAIAGIRTGQWGEGGESWQAEFSLSFPQGRARR